MTQTILSAASTFQTAGSCYHKILAGRIACVTKATRRRPFEAAAYSLVALNEREISPATRRAVVSWRSSCLDALFRSHRVSFADQRSAAAESASVCYSSLYASSASLPDEWPRFAVLPHQGSAEPSSVDRHSGLACR